MVPAAAIQLDQCASYGLPIENPFASVITPVGSERPEVKSLIKRLQFRLRRLVSQLRMGWRQAPVQCKAERVLVQINQFDFLLPYKSKNPV